MTKANVFGAHTTLGQVRKSYEDLIRMWLPDYLRESERTQGTPVNQVALPRSWVPAERIDKWPEHTLPAIIISSPGLLGRPTQRPAHEGPWSTFEAPVILVVSAVVAGAHWADVQRSAELYGDALKQLILGRGFSPPGIDVESLVFEDEAYDDLPQRTRRTYTAASVTFTVTIRDWGSDADGPLVPRPTPWVDPGPLPEVVETPPITVERK